MGKTPELHVDGTGNIYSGPKIGVRHYVAENAALRSRIEELEESIRKLHSLNDGLLEEVNEIQSQLVDAENMLFAIKEQAVIHGWAGAHYAVMIYETKYGAIGRSCHGGGE